MSEKIQQPFMLLRNKVHTSRPIQCARANEKNVLQNDDFLALRRGPNPLDLFI